LVGLGVRLRRPWLWYAFVVVVVVLGEWWIAVGEGWCWRW